MGASVFPDKLHGDNNGALTFHFVCRICVQPVLSACQIGGGASHKLLSRVCHDPAIVSVDRLSPLCRLAIK
jgi:hypothetical protein